MSGKKGMINNPAQMPGYLPKAGQGNSLDSSGFIYFFLSNSLSKTEFFD